MFDIEDYLEDTTGKKYCSKCREWKLFELFPKNKNSKDGLNHWCKKCNNKNTSSWQKDKKNNHKVTNRMIKHRYNITLEERNVLERSQNGLCKICLKKKKLVIEHCHRTKKVRGLTCNGCNVKIAWYERNKGRIEEHVE